MVRVGFCQCAITPPVGIELAGYANRVQPSIGILDDLYIRCVILEDVGIAVAIAVLDILGVPRDLWQDIAISVEKIVGIPRDNIVVLATHTHSGPSIRSDRIYREYLVRSVAGCILCAYNNLDRLEQLTFGKRIVPDLVYNRRRPREGDVDPELVVSILKLSNGRRLAIVNYTCHPVVLGPDNRCISADFPGALVNHLRRLVDVEQAMFMNGCAGDINPFTPSTDLSKPYVRKGTYREVQEFGYALALEATRASMMSSRLSVDHLDYVYRDIVLKLRPPDVNIERLGVLLEEAEHRGDRYMIWKLRRVKEVLTMYGNRRELEFRIASLRLGNLFMVFMPAEVFVEHQLYIKRFSPTKNLIVAAYANSYDGYIPTAEAFEEGGYEVEYPVSIVEKGEGEKLRNAVLDLLTELS